MTNCFPVLLCVSVDAVGVSTTATVSITLKETNDFPPQILPLTGTVCEGAALTVTAVDEDFPPHSSPFKFEIYDDQLANWTITQINGTLNRQ